MAVACNRGAGNATVTWKVEPTPAVTGAATVVRVAVHTSQGQPLGGATLHLEAHMSHPGMAPLTADLVERALGQYEATIQFSMPGDWVLVVTGMLADGNRITSQLPVAAGRPSG